MISAVQGFAAAYKRIFITLNDWHWDADRVSVSISEGFMCSTTDVLAYFSPQTKGSRVLTAVWGRAVRRLAQRNNIKYKSLEQPRVAAGYVRLAPHSPLELVPR